ncbi:MAG TPA: DUF1579 family protein [Candidatus Dormibacteraeota bacterium]|nr:DUF1579 family protein [Candidatus Dormibacteraeota bacterium]
MNRRLALIPILIMVAASAWAQMSATPGPEVKKLDYFVGAWTTECTIVQGPWGMGGKFTSSATNEWMSGNFFVSQHNDFKMPPELGGEGKGASFMGYDSDQSVYTLDAFNSQGRRESWKGSLAADTWTWTGSQTYAGQEFQQKMTIKTLSPTSYSVKFEISMDGKNFMTFMEGKATKK